MNISILINKANVYDEVAKTTSYDGDKKGNYDKVFTTDDDRLMLERFWVEASNEVIDAIKNFIVSVSSQESGRAVDLKNNFTAVLDMPPSFDVNLTGGLNTSLFSFFVNAITGKWMAFTNQENGTNYTQLAIVSMDDAQSKLYYRKKPIRIIPT